MASTSDLAGRLHFLREAERLKNVLRSGHTSSGRAESTAEHSWRLCLLAMSLQDLLAPLNFERVLKLCVVHDLGEALGGDVPAPAQVNTADKSATERRDLIALCKSLPVSVQAELLSLWDEYEAAQTPEAQVVKALDKIETIVQHNQGANPADFDHSFNLAYGRQYAQCHPVIAELRALVDEETRRNALAQHQAAPAPPQMQAQMQMQEHVRPGPGSRPRGMKTLLGFATHLAALALGFAVGVYALPILIAPAPPAAAELSAHAAAAVHRGEFRRDLKDSDALHWGEGVVTVGATSIGLVGKLAPGPDYKLYLSPEFLETEADFQRLKPRMVRVADVRTFNNFLVAVPPGVEVARFNTVVIWCETFGQFITAARYR